MKKRYSQTGLVTLLMMITAGLLAGCTQDDGAVLGPETPADGSVKLNISLPPPVVKNMNTRVGAADFDVLNDLNVVVANGDMVIAREYFDLATASFGNPKTDPVALYKNENGTLAIHFAKSWLTYWGANSTSDFYLVGNYGRELASSELSSVATLLGLRERVGTDGFVNNPCLMFAQATPIAGNHGHEGGTSLQAELRRTVAMVTVAIDGSELAPNVVIEPLSISLHNVPAWCTLGEDNVITTTPGGTTPLAGAVIENGHTFSFNDLRWTPIAGQGSHSSVGNLNHSIGTHKVDSVGIQPLFLFENIHGDNFGAPIDPAEQRYKRPRSVDMSGTPAENRAAIEAATTACSYLEVTANYRKLDATTGAILFGGTVAWRVFLGEDAHQSFDVKRDTHYQFTLTLRGNAVTEGGEITNGALQLNPDAVTWRVESFLHTTVFGGESDYMFNGAGRTLFLEQMNGANQEASGFITEVGFWDNPTDNGSFVYMNFDSNQGDPTSSWAALGTVSPDHDRVGPNDNGQREFHIYVQPMIRNITWFGAPNDHDRQVSFRIVQTTAQPRITTDLFTITQYEPIPVTIDSDSPQEIQDYVTEVLGRSLPFAFYVDRIDRDMMPWGFDGLVLNDIDLLSGVENGYRLMENYSTVADDYLPFGRGIAQGDMSDRPASAMMHAALMHSYQWNGAPTISTNAITSQTTLPLRPDDPDFDPKDDSLPLFVYGIPSRAEWKLLDMLQQYPQGVFSTEYPGIFDPDQPVLSWYDYWTSDPVPGSATESYVYRVGQGLDPSDYPPTLVRDRTTPLRYRLIFYAPKIAD